MARGVVSVLSVLHVHKLCHTQALPPDDKEPHMLGLKSQLQMRYSERRRLNTSDGDENDLH